MIAKIELEHMRPSARSRLSLAVVPAWRAHCKVPSEYEKAPGVNGAATEEGPWIEAYGDTPVEALKRLQEKLGAVTMLLESA